MARNIKNIEVEGLAGEVANLTRLQAGAGKPGGRKSLRQYLEQNVWPVVPAGELGRVMSREEEDHIVGYGPQGY
jgi:antitoxin VapB